VRAFALGCDATPLFLATPWLVFGGSDHVSLRPRLVGWNAHGQAGTGPEDKDVLIPEPVLVPRLEGTGDEGMHVLAASCGVAHSLALVQPRGQEEGGELQTRVCSWGLDEDGQLGHGSREFVEEFANCTLRGGSLPTCFAPRVVEALDQRNVVSVACGSHRSMARTAGGQVFIWGRDTGKLISAQPEVSFSSSRPRLTNLPEIQDKQVVSVAAGFDAVVIVTTTQTEAQPTAGLSGDESLCFDLARLIQHDEAPTLASLVDMELASPGGEACPAHRSILSARLPLVNAAPQPVPGAPFRVVVKGTTVDDLKQLILWCYTGACPDGDAVAYGRLVETAAACGVERESLSSLEESTARQRVGRDLQAFVLTGKYCDVMLQDASGLEYVQAHRAVLAARSDYFQSMLCGNFLESTAEHAVPSEGGGYSSSITTIPMPEFSGGALRSLVQFFYSGALSDELETDLCIVTCELIALADLCCLPILVRLLRRTSPCASAR